VSSAPRRPRGRRPAEEPPSTGTAAADAEPDPESVARTIALRQLAAAPRTRAQLRDTLARRNVPDDVAERVLDRFEEVSLLDDAEYARMWVESRQAGRGLARRALAEELRQRGVPPERAGDALDRIDPDVEVETARSLVARRLPAGRGLNRDARARRLAGMLARKGYSSGTALRVVREALAAEGEDLDESASPPG
jgi:regulatory protein